MHLALDSDLEGAYRSDFDATVCIALTRVTAKGLSASDFQAAIKKQIIEPIVSKQLDSLTLGYVTLGDRGYPLTIRADSNRFTWLTWDGDLQRMVPENPGLYRGPDSPEADCAAAGINIKIELDIGDHQCPRRKEIIDITLVNDLTRFHELHAMNRKRENSFGQSMQSMAKYLWPVTGTPGPLFEALRAIKSELKELKKQNHFKNFI